MRDELLSIKAGTKSFGAVKALDGVDLQVCSGEVTGVVGPNGSGKTTLFNCVTGFTRFDSGQVLWDGQDVTAWAPDRLARRGIVRTFQQVRLFPELSVLENVRRAILCRSGFRSRRGPDSALPHDEWEVLRFAGLAEIGGSSVSEVSYGSQRLAAVAMAIAAEPRLLMLDEPAAGLHASEIDQLGDLLLRLQEAGVTILIIDHNMRFLLPLCRRVVVLDAGTKLMEGSAEEVQNDERVMEVYLGTQSSKRDASEGDSEQSNLS